MSKISLKVGGIVQYAANIKGYQEVMVLEEDFEQLFHLYYSRLYNFFFYRVQNQHLAEDLTSQTFERLMYKRSTLSAEKGKFEVWLFAIARNILNDYFRRQKKYPWTSIEQVADSLASQITVEQDVIFQEDIGQMLELVKGLKEKERNIIAYKFGAQLKNREIGEILNLSEKNVSVMLHRTLKKLKETLEEGVVYER